MNKWIFLLYIQCPGKIIPHTISNKSILIFRWFPHLILCFQWSSFKSQFDIKLISKLELDFFSSYPNPNISVLVFQYLSIALISVLSLNFIALSHFQALSFLALPICSCSLNSAICFSENFLEFYLPLNFHNTEFVSLVSIYLLFKWSHTHILATGFKKCLWEL